MDMHKFPMERKEVYSIIDEEREYQNKRWGKDRTNSLEAWITYMEYYLGKAKEELVFDLQEVALDDMRKVVALGIACFEEWGIPTRDSMGHSQEKIFFNEK